MLPRSFCFWRFDFILFFSPLLLFAASYFLLISSETKVCSQESTTTAFSTVTLPTTTYVNGVSPNPPSSEDALSPKSSPPQEEPLTQAENLESQSPPLTRAPTHQLLSIHHTLFEQEEDKENRRDRLAERPGELIAAGECWRRRKRGLRFLSLTLYLTHMTTMSITSDQQPPLVYFELTHTSVMGWLMGRNGTTRKLHRELLYT